MVLTVGRVGSANCIVCFILRCEGCGLSIGLVVVFPGFPVSTRNLVIDGWFFTGLILFFVVGTTGFFLVGGGVFTGTPN